MSNFVIQDIIAVNGTVEILCVDGVTVRTSGGLSHSIARKLARLLFQRATEAEDQQLDALRQKLDHSKAEQGAIESEIRSLEANRAARQQGQSVVDEKRMVPRVPGDPRI